MVRLTMQGGIGQLVLETTAKLSDMSELMESIAQSLDASVRDNFREEQSPYGVDWPRHTPTTEALYAKGGLFGRTRGGRGSRRLLVRTGRLRGSLTPKHTRSTATLEVTGDARQYGYVHQFGNPKNRLPNRPPGRYRDRAGKIRPNFPPLAPIPARQFMPLTPEGKTDLPADLVKDIMDLAAAYISEASQ